MPRLFRQLALVLVLASLACASEQPDVDEFIREHRFADGRMALLLYWPQNHKFASDGLSRLEKRASSELRTLMANAEDEYKSALGDRHAGKEKEATGHNLESIGLLRRGIKRFGPLPVFFYDISLNYYDLRDLKNARYFLELTDAFLPTDKSFHTYETLRSLVLSGAVYRGQFRNTNLYRQLDTMISKPYLYSQTEDTIHYDSVCNFLLTDVVGQEDLDHLTLTNRHLELSDRSEPPPEVLFNLIKCAERKGYVQTADLLVRQYDAVARDSYLDPEYQADRDFIAHLSDAVKRAGVEPTKESEIANEVIDKVSTIMQARELRDYVTVDKEYRDTVGIRSPDLIEELRWGRARWLRMCGKIDDARSASATILSNINVSDSRFPELKLDFDGLPTSRAQYDRLRRLATSQIAQVSRAEGSSPQIMYSTLGMVAGSLAQARRLFPYAMEVNSSLAWVHLQVGDHRGLVEDLDVAPLHNQFVTFPVCVHWAPRDRFKKAAASACGMFQVRPAKNGQLASFGWSKLADPEHALDGSLFSTLEPDEIRPLSSIEKITRTRDGDVRIDLQGGERVLFTVHTVFDLVYTQRNYFDTLTGGQDSPLLRSPGEKRSMPLAIRRARGNDLIIALVRYGAPSGGSTVLAPELLRKVSRDGLSFWDWVIIVNYTWVAGFGTVYNVQNGSAGPLVVRLVNFVQQGVGTFEAQNSWRYALISRRAGDPRVRTRFRVVPLGPLSFLTKW
jgi:hypothetical protein